MTKSCTAQGPRATALGRMIRKHASDVVLLQEMWGSGFRELEVAMQPKGLATLTTRAVSEIEKYCKSVAAAEAKSKAKGADTNAALELPPLPPHLEVLLEQLDKAHKASAEPYGVPQDDERDDAARAASDLHYKERSERDCADYYTHATDASRDVAAGRYADAGQLFPSSAAAAIAANASAEEKEKEATTTTSAPSAGHAAAAALGAALPPLYHLPYMMRSWRVEFVDTAVQYFSKRGGLMHAVNTNTTDFFESSASKGGYWPLLSELRERGLLERSGCGGLVALVEEQAALAAERAKQNLLLESGSELVKETKTDTLPARLVQKAQAALNAFMEASNGREKLEAVLPAYPRHHRFIATHYPSHNKSVIVIKGIKKRAIALPTSNKDTKSEAETERPPIPLLVFNTHLDPMNLGPKHRLIERQVIELKAFIADVIAKEHYSTQTGAIPSPASAPAPQSDKSSDGTNNKKKKKTTVYDVNVGAVIAGDFNIPAHSPLYPRLFEIMGGGEMTIELEGRDGEEALLAEKRREIEERKKKGGSSGSSNPSSRNASFGANAGQKKGGSTEAANTEGEGSSSSTSEKKKVDNASTPQQQQQQQQRAVLKTCVELGVMLPPSSLAVHTYCSHNTYVQHPEDEGRLDHIFSVKSVTITYGTYGAVEGEAKAAEGEAAIDEEEEEEEVVTYRLQPITLTYERVLNDHKGGDALVSDHYPFIADFVVGE